MEEFGSERAGIERESDSLPNEIQDTTTTRDYEVSCLKAAKLALWYFLTSTPTRVKFTKYWKKRTGELQTKQATDGITSY
jgi:hypothetical protein